jgi:hypothetical protein
MQYLSAPRRLYRVNAYLVQLATCTVIAVIVSQHIQLKGCCSLKKTISNFFNTVCQVRKKSCFYKKIVIIIYELLMFTDAQTQQTKRMKVTFRTLFL